MPLSFRVFLNNPPTARAIADFGAHVRWGTGLDARTIEIICLRVATVLSDGFMRAHHAVLAREAGLSDLEVTELGRPESSRGLPKEDRPLVAFVDAVLRTSMTDEVFRALEDRLGGAATLDVAVATAYWSMHHLLFSTLGLVGDVDTRVPLAKELQSQRMVDR